jgi:spermidine synthase
MGIALVATGRIDKAIECFNEVLKQNEDSAEVHYNLAAAFGMQKKYDEAIKHLTKVLQLDPNYPDAHNRMGVALISTGRSKEAIEYFNEALRTSPNQPEAYANIGLAYAQLENYGPAIQNLTKAVELKPNRTDILNALAWILATIGEVSIRDANKAVEYAQRACELTKYKEPALLDTLAAAYAAAGRFNDAVTTAQRAIDEAKARVQENLVGEIQSRLELYRAGQPYRQKRMTDDR